MDKHEDPNQDEYQFSDLDMMEPESGDVVEAPKADETQAASPLSLMDRINKDILLKAALAVGGLVFFLLMYKFIASMFAETKPDVIVPPPVVKPIASPVISAPVVHEKPLSEINQKIVAIEQNQGNLTADMGNLNNQVSQLSASLNEMNNKIQQLTETVNALATQVAQQSQQLQALAVRAKPVKRQYVRRPAPIMARVYYSIQAVIPGRAWLVANNGTTLTVREGSTIPGYGVVKLIDPNEGRVLTSSGRSITFSQQDS